MILLCNLYTENMCVTVRQALTIHRYYFDICVGLVPFFVSKIRTKGFHERK